MKMSSLHALEFKKKENFCKNAINQKTSYIVNGFFGSSIESEWHPSSIYVLFNEMKRFELIKRKYVKKKFPWRFEFVEMVGGKTIVFVNHQKIFKNFCGGPNAFFVIKK